MATSTKKESVSAQTKEEALKVARATQRPGQTKEQTRLIAQGIQKGIDFYKKQQKAKARELDKRLKRAKQIHKEPVIEKVTETTHAVVYRQHKLPWVLLVISWAGMAGYFALYS